ncbi:MAG: hypothetical protein Q4C58_13735, partial [Eubacteriales bacterium]|nr:hypothetical protein [Eubacteriales bacterium]
ENGKNKERTGGGETASASSAWQGKGMEYRYLYRIAGIGILIRTSFPICQDCAMAPFEETEGEAEARLEYQIERAKVSRPEGEMIWKGRGLEVYRSEAGIRQLFVMNRGGREFLALLGRGESPGKYRLWADEGYCEMFEEEGKLYSYLGMEQGLAENEAFYLHASVVQWKGRTILFTAPSGTGKSTQASLWEKYRKAEILNGDRAIVRKEKEGYSAYGSPFAGSSGIYRNEGAPVWGIAVLRQGKENRIERLEPGEAVKYLLSETMVSAWDDDFMRKLLGILTEAATCVPVYAFSCRPDESAVEALEDILKSSH